MSNIDRQRVAAVRKLEQLGYIFADGNGMHPPNDADAPRLKSTKRLTIADMQHAAASFGGECLSTEYVSLRTTMRWRCAAGHEWEAQAQNVRRGKWCLRCSGKMRKTIDEMHTLAHSRGGVCLSRTYKNMATKLTWRCACGHRWKARPHLVSQGQWCPRCANESRRKKMRGNTNAKGAAATSGKTRSER